MRRILLTLVSIVAGLLLVSPASAATKTVSIKRAAFSPSSVNITAGDSIRWRNDDSRDHQVVSSTGAFASPALRPGRTLAALPCGTSRLRIAMSVNQAGAGYLGAFSREISYRRGC